MARGQAAGLGLRREWSGVARSRRGSSASCVSGSRIRTRAVEKPRPRAAVCSAVCSAVLKGGGQSGERYPKYGGKPFELVP